MVGNHVVTAVDPGGTFSTSFTVVTQNFTLPTGGTQLLEFRVSVGTSGDSSATIDNVSITPEPASLALLGLGGLSLLARRRRAETMIST